MLFQPEGQLIGLQPGIPKLRRLQHEHAVARRGLQGIHHIDLLFRILCLQILCRNHRRIIGPRDTRGQGNVNDILPLCEKWFKKLRIFPHAHLGCPGNLAGEHPPVHVGRGHRLSEIIVVVIISQAEMKIDVLYILLFQCPPHYHPRGTHPVP